MTDSMQKRIARAILDEIAAQDPDWGPNQEDCAPGKLDFVGVEGRLDFDKIAAAALKATFEWQLTETAPNDEMVLFGSWIQALDGSGGVIKRWVVFEGMWRHAKWGQEPPTHWMHLPPPVEDRP